MVPVLWLHKDLFYGGVSLEVYLYAILTVYVENILIFFQTLYWQKTESPLVGDLLYMCLILSAVPLVYVMNICPTLALLVGLLLVVLVGWLLLFVLPLLSLLVLLLLMLPLFPVSSQLLFRTLF